MSARPIAPIALALATALAFAAFGAALADDAPAAPPTPSAAPDPNVVLKPDAPDSAAHKPVAPPAPAAKKKAPARDSGDPLVSSWLPGRQWMSFRLGFARSGGTDAPDGSIGGGIGYSRVLTGVQVWRWNVLRRWSLGGYAQFDQLGRFGNAAGLEIPVTAELVRHFNWSTPNFRPYLGVGAGGFYRKLYRTGRDFAAFKPGEYLTLGANLPVDAHQLLGIDLRIARVNGLNNGNPVFGDGKRHVTHWSLKFGYAITY